MAIRAIVVDDTGLFRRVMTEALAPIENVEVVATAATGQAGLAKIIELKPDIVTLDIEMPGMDGLAVLDALRAANVETGVIVVSALTMRGGELTIRALSKGAFDFVTKPSGGTPDENIQQVRRSIEPLIRAYMRRREVQAILKGGARPASAQPSTEATTSNTTIPNYASVFAKPDSAGTQAPKLPVKAYAELIVIGVSTGGPNALSQILPGFTTQLGVPIFIVQHMPPHFTKSLADSLGARCTLPVNEAVNGEMAKPNQIYIAPGGKHMKLVSADGGIKIILTEDPAEHNCRPAVDYLFRSVAHGFPGKACAAILTGMGSDGTIGLKLLKRHGCYVVAQDEASCVVFGMPKAAIAAGVVDDTVPIEKIAHSLQSAVKRR